MKILSFTYPYIVIEGMDGSGKETASIAMTQVLNSIGNDYSMVSFPQYDTPSGILIRDYLRRGTGEPRTFSEIKDDSILYTINRFSYFTDNNLLLRGGRFVFDRWTTSNMLYQTRDMTDEEKVEYVDWIERLEYDILRLPSPSIVFVLRCSASRSSLNIASRGLETDFFEVEEEQEKIRKNIDFFVKHRNWVPIDVDVDGEMRPTNEIVNQMLDTMGIFITNR